MIAAAMRARRNPVRHFDVTTNPGKRSGFSARIAFGMAVVALTVATAIAIFEVALRTAESVMIDEALLPATEQADISFGDHRVSFPGAWLTGTGVLDDKMATVVTLRLPYDKLLSLKGTVSAVDTAEGANPHDVFLRLQVPPPGLSGIDLVNAVYLPKSRLLERPGPAGLSQRLFHANTGYDGEILYIGRDQETEFVARCSTSGDPTPSRACLRTVAISQNLEVVILFDPALLVDWRQIDDVVRALIRSITVR